MGHHTFDASQADRLEDPARRYCIVSTEELRWALDASEDAAVADLGSGTGFYTDDVAPHVGTVHAVDIQESMHDYYRGKGIPENVELVTSGIESLPLATDSLDSAFSIMTYHEFASADALGEINRVLKPNGRLVIFDWAATGTGDRGPPLEERYTAQAAVDRLGESGFAIEHSAVRPETFLVVATV